MTVAELTQADYEQIQKRAEGLQMAGANVGMREVARFTLDLIRAKQRGAVIACTKCNGFGGHYENGDHLP